MGLVVVLNVDPNSMSNRSRVNGIGPDDWGSQFHQLEAQSNPKPEHCPRRKVCANASFAKARARCFKTQGYPVLAIFLRSCRCVRRRSAGAHRAYVSEGCIVVLVLRVFGFSTRCHNTPRFGWGMILITYCW